MARTALRHRSNAAGPWFVDTRCIDCGTCRDVAPSIFADVGDQSIVSSPPHDEASELLAWLAAQACPTSSIGTTDHRPRPGRLYPREIEDNSGVFDTGYCSEDSFGASAWFVTRPDGNLLIDSPRFTDALAAPFEALGGIRHILVTHRDDVADARRWADRFGARVWIHEDDARAAPFATDLLTGGASVDIEIAGGVVAVPVPGHTRGSVAYVVDERWAFTGDSLAWSHERDDLTAFRNACWYSWPEQARSLASLAARHGFEWVLPGHGARKHLDRHDMHDRLTRLVERMVSAGGR
jgi:glyoxylase-like metal-dependent hydrolase (beta-lactamase superfamily II)/ferredoxin